MDSFVSTRNPLVDAEYTDKQIEEMEEEAQWQKRIAPAIEYAKAEGVTQGRGAVENYSRLKQFDTPPRMFDLRKDPVFPHKFFGDDDLERWEIECNRLTDGCDTQDWFYRPLMQSYNETVTKLMPDHSNPWKPFEWRRAEK